MTSFNFDKFTEFGKVKDIWCDTSYDKKGLQEFLNNVIMNMDTFDEKNNNGFGIMLPDLSDIYVLVSKPEFPFDQIDSSHKNSIDYGAAKHNFVLGYIWLCPWKLEKEDYIPYHFINFIDSRISGLNIAKYMIDEYECECEERYIFPYEVGLKAAEYWKKYFNKSYDIKNKNDLQKMIIDFGFKTGDIKWDNLIEIF
jgi:hypothetical protein